MLMSVQVHIHPVILMPFAVTPSVVSLVIVIQDSLETAQTVKVIYLRMMMLLKLTAMFLSAIFCLSLDIDECSDIDLNVCDREHGTCNNSIGSYSCQCNIGFTGNGSVCTGKIHTYVGAAVL